MLLWRLGKRVYASSLDGEGARRAGGRWNREGIPAVYTSRSPATATLEILVHLEAKHLPDDYALTCLDVPDTVSGFEPDPSAFPADWRNILEHPYCQALGSTWLKERASLMLIVPSAVIPEEANVILNPLHPEIDRVRIRSVQPFRFDPRLGYFLSES